MLRAVRGDRGAASLEFATLAVAFMMVVLTVIQVGMYQHARKVAASAARHGVEAGRQINSSDSDGIAQATEYLARFGGSVKNPAVTSDGGTAEEIRITVTGNVPTLVSGLEFAVTQYADAPRERWTNP